MKYKKIISWTLALALMPALTLRAAIADFSGTQISNNMPNGTAAAPPDGTFTGTTTLNYTNGVSENGAVFVSTPGLTTRLEGKIDIKASNPNANTASYVSGVRLTSSGTALLIGDISIEVSSYAGSGVKLSSDNAFVKLDAGNSGKTITIDVIDLAPSTNHTTEASAIHVSNGRVEVVGNLATNANQMRGYGLWTGDSGNGSIRVDGNTTLLTHGKEGLGIRLDHGAIDLHGNLTIVTGSAPSTANTDGSAGIRAINGTLTVSGSSYIQTSGNVATVGTLISTRESAYGIWNTSASRLDGAGATLTFGDVTIVTDGQAAHGVYNDSLAGLITFNGATHITTSGPTGSVSWNRGSSSKLGVNETVGAYGVNSALTGTTVFNGPLTVTTTGEKSGGLRSTGGLIQTREVNITTRGAEAYGIVASSTGVSGSYVATGNLVGDIQVNGAAAIATSGSGAHAVYATGSGNIALNGGLDIASLGPDALSINADKNATVSGSGKFTGTGGIRSASNAAVNLTMTGGADYTGNLSAADRATLAVTLTGDAHLTGDAATTGSARLSLVLNDQAVFIGHTGTAGAGDTLNVSVANRARWDLTADSHLTALTLTGGIVNYQNTGAYKHIRTLTLTGAGGEIIMNTNLAANHTAGDQNLANLNSDFLTVSGSATGTHLITIRDRSNGSITGGEYALWLVTTGTSANNLTFSGTSNITQGDTTYTYTVVNGNDANKLLAGGTAAYQVSGNANDWYLLLTDTATTTITTITTVTITGTTTVTGSTTITGSTTVTGTTAVTPPPSPVGPGIQVINSIALAPHTAWFIEQDTLLKRMGELRLGASGLFDNNNQRQTPAEWETWVRGYGSQYNIGGQVTGAPFRQYLYGGDLGADRSWTDDHRQNVYYTGLYGGYARADQNYRAYADEASSDSYYGGFYGTWINEVGWYADLVGKAAYYDNAFSVWDDRAIHATGDYGNWALGISLELGRQFKFKDDWYAEPQVQASYAHFFGGNYQTGGDTPFRVDYRSADLWQFRYGTLFGRTIKLDKDDRKDWGFIQPYIKVFGQNQISRGGHLRTPDTTTRPNLDGWSAVVGAGIVWQLDETNQLHLDYEAVFARKYDKPWGINFGYRHQF